MNWYSDLEKRRKSALFALVLLAVVMLAVSSLRNTVSYDSYWHLKMGQDWVENGLSPYQDHLSFTFDGEAIQSPPVVFQWGLYQLTEALGQKTAYRLYKFASMVLCLILLLAWLKQTRAPVWVYGLVIFTLVCLLQLRASVRPELISYSFCLLSLMVYQRALARTAVTTMLPVVLVMWAWTNYHSAILGYVIFFGLFVDLAIKQFIARAGWSAWLNWGFWGALVVAIGFLNPSLTHPIIHALNFSSEWRGLLQEYLSPAMYKGIPAIYVILLFSLVTLALAWRQRRIGLLIVCLVMLYQALSMARFVTPAGIVILGVFALVMSRVDLKGYFDARPAALSRGVSAVLLACFLLTTLTAVAAAREMVHRNADLVGYFPAGLVAYMQDSGLAGRIYNEYELGGYLAYNLAPASKVYIDGRTDILYPVEFAQHYFASKNNAAEVSALFEQHQVDYAVLTHSAANARLIDHVGGFSLDFADVRYFMYRKGTGNFATAGLLWGKPYCWADSMSDELRQEYRQAILLLSPSSPFLAYLGMMTSYANATDRSEFLKTLPAEAFVNDSSKRWVAYRAVENGFDNEAFVILQSVETQEARDFLAMATLLLKLGRVDDAEKLIDHATRQRWNDLEFIDLQVLLALAEAIEQQHGLNYVDKAYVQSLAQQVGESRLEGTITSWGFRGFCQIN